MSNFCAPTFHPKTGKIEHASWLDDYFGHHEYGVRFPSDGVVYKSYDCERVLPKAMAEIERLRAKTEWRDIDDGAPTDGTPVFLYVNGVGVCTGMYDDFNGEWRVGPSLGGDFVWPDESDPIDRYDVATHWKPLDAPEGE